MSFVGFFQNNHIKPGPVMLQNLLLPLARFLYFVLTMLEIIATYVFSLLTLWSHES